MLCNIPDSYNETVIGKCGQPPKQEEQRPMSKITD